VNPSPTTAIVSACLLAAVWVGIWLRHFLPDHHLSPDSRDTVKLAMGLVATMSAVLLGLLVSSAKISYETTHAQVMQRAAKFALLDRLLVIYGPAATVVRGQLHDLVAEATQRMWPDESAISAPPKPGPGLGNAFYASLLRLEARGDTELTLKAQAVSLALELGQLQSLMLAESSPSISKPMLVVVVVWLVMIFLGFSLLTPPNVTSMSALIVSALCVAGAIFLILELDQPFGGFMRISSEPMLNVLHELGN
jgi:hypothetical protein